MRLKSLIGDGMAVFEESASERNNNNNYKSDDELDVNALLLQNIRTAALLIALTRCFI